MQVAEVKRSSSASPTVQAKRQPFFSKEGQDSFFSKSNETTESFFNPTAIQTKLTIGQPNDKYEVEADAMADQVVQRLLSNTATPKQSENSTLNVVQPKCDTCDKEEEEVQKKEDDLQKVEEQVPEIQEKPIFESNAEEAVQTKPEVVTPLESSINLDSTQSDNIASNPVIQAKCENCEEEEMEEHGKEQELQRKESTAAAGDPPEEEDPSVQLRSLEMEKTEYPILFKKIPNLQLSSRGGSGSGTREQIVEEAQQMVGKIEAKKDDGSGGRVGAEHLLEIFHLAADDAWSDEVIENVRYKEEFPHWCGIFSVYAIKKAGIDLGFWQVGMGVSSYGTLEPTDNPQPGDIGYFTKFQHHCIIKAVNGDTIDSIDGNSGNFSEVIERTRPRSDFHAFFTAYTGSEQVIQKNEEVAPAVNSGTSNLQDKLNSSSGKGTSMDEGTRSEMESGFGMDFSNVNIHTDSTAVQMNKDLNAQAFTHGNDIYFNQGKYDSGSTSGKHLLAHELTHTVQQGAVPNLAPKIQKNGSGYEEQERRLNTLFSGIVDERLPLFNQAVDTQNQREAGLSGRRILFLWSEVTEIVSSIASQEVNASEEYQESRISELLPPVIRQSYDLTKSGILTRLSTQLYKGTSVLDRQLIESELENTMSQFISQQIARVSWVIKDLNAAVALLNRQNLEEEHQWTFIGLIRQHQDPFDFGYMYKVLEDKRLLDRIASFAEAPSLSWEVINRSQIFIRETVTLDPGQELGLFRLKPVESKLELLQPMTPKEISQRIYQRRQSWRELLHPYNRAEIASNNGDTLLHAGTELRIIPALIADDQLQWIFMSVENALKKEDEEGTNPYLRQTTNHTPVVGNNVTFQLFWPPNGFPDHNIQWAFQNDSATSPNASRIEGPTGFIHWEEENSNDTWELRAGYPGIHQIFTTLTPRHGSGSRELSLEQMVLTTEEQTEIAFAQAAGVNSQSPQEFLETLRERKRNATNAREREEIEARIQEIETSLQEDTRHPLSGQRTILRPLQAVFISNEDQPLSVPLRMFIGSDPDWFAGDTRGYHMKIWDYTLQESTKWTGEHDDRMQEAAKDAIQSFADYAPYPDGILRVRVPDYGRYDRQEILTIETGGGRAVMDFIRALSMISLAVGVGSAFLGQPEIAIPAFALASALGGAAGSFNIATKLEHGNFEWDLETGMDILDVAGAVMTFGASSVATTTVRGVGRVTFMGRMSQAIDATQIVVMSGMHVAQIATAIASGDRDRVVNALLSALADGALFLIIHRAGRRLQRGGTAVDDPRLHQLEGRIQDASSVIRADGTITIGGESHGMSLVMVDGQIVVRICSPNCSQLARALGHAMELPEVRNDTALRNRLETLELEASRLESRVNNVEEDFTFEDAQPRVNEMLDDLRAIGRDHPNLVDAIFNRSGMPEPEAHLSGHGSMFRAVEEGGAHRSESIRYVETPTGEIRAVDASAVPETLRTGQSFDIDGQTYKYLGDIEQRLLIDEGFSARDLGRAEMRTRIQESHDRGVELGRVEASREGVRLAHFDPPDQYLGLFGKGIDDLGRRGNVFYILEWKGGTSRLGSDQMSDAWVGRKLAELEIYNDPRAQQLLTAALGGRLKGRGYRTQRADDGSWETTRMDEGPLQGGEIVYDGQRVRSAYERRLAELRTRHGLDTSGAEVQPKLTTGKPHDRYELEADAMADKVVQKLSNPRHGTSTPVIQAKCTACEEKEKIQKREVMEVQRKPIFENEAEDPNTNPYDPNTETVQRKCAACETEEGVQLKGETGNEGNTANMESQLNASNDSGSPLAPETQKSMNTGFGTDFSQVRIHTDSNAVEMNKSLNAQAFTHGNDIYFNQGKYDPSTSQGKHLLAHELTHTKQQASGSETNVPRIQKNNKPFDPATVKIRKTTNGPVTNKHDSGFKLKIESPFEGTHYYYRWSARDPENNAYFMRSSENNSIVQQFGTSKSVYLNTPSLQKMYARGGGSGFKVLCRVAWSKSASLPRPHNTPDDSKLIKIMFSFSPRDIDYEQNTKALKNRVWESAHQQQFTEALEHQPTNLDDDLKNTKQMIMLQKMAIFNKVLESPHSGVDKNFRDKWVGAMLAIETIKSMIGNDNYIGLAADQAKSALTAFYAKYITIQGKREQFYKEQEDWSKSLQPTKTQQFKCPTANCHQPVEPSQSPTFPVLMAPPLYSPTLRLYFSQVFSANNNGSWNAALKNLNKANGSLEELLVSNLSADAKEVTSLNYSKGLLKRQEKLKNEHSDAIRIPAVFYPENEIVDVTDKKGNKKKMAQGIPWLFYLHNTSFQGYDRPAMAEGQWVLQDMTSPKQIKVNKKASSVLDSAIVQQGGRVDPPIELFEELNSALRFPKGRLYWKMPKGKDWTIKTTEPISLSQFLSYLSIGLAALGLILLSGGAGTPAAVALIGSAAVGVGSTLAEMQEKSDHGVLTQDDINKGALFIAADIASALSLGMGRVISVAAHAGRMSKMAAIAGRYYTTVNRASAILDIASVIVVTSDFVKQFNAIRNQEGLSDKEKEKALTKLVTMGILTGAVLTPSVVGGLKEFKKGSSIHLLEGMDGKLIPRIDLDPAVAKKTLPEADNDFLEFMEDLPIESITTEMLLRELEIAKKSPFQFAGDPGSDVAIQISLTNKHTWKQSFGGKWCRYSKPLCILLGEGMESAAVREVSPGRAGLKGHDAAAKAARAELRGDLGPSPGKGWQAHHIIPYELRSHKVFIALSDLGILWNINAKKNGIHLPTTEQVRGSGKLSLHFGSHPTYNGWLESRLDMIYQQFNVENLSGTQLQQAVNDLVTEFEFRLRTGKIRLSKNKSF